MLPIAVLSRPVPQILSLFFESQRNAEWHGPHSPRCSRSMAFASFRGRGATSMLGQH
jgi:hypothetical protein